VSNGIQPGRSAIEDFHDRLQIAAVLFFEPQGVDFEDAECMFGDLFGNFSLRMLQRGEVTGAAQNVVGFPRSSLAPGGNRLRRG
jgi:hypothetical protein